MACHTVRLKKKKEKTITCAQHSAVIKQQPRSSVCLHAGTWAPAGLLGECILEGGVQSWMAFCVNISAGETPECWSEAAAGVCRVYTGKRFPFALEKPPDEAVAVVARHVSCVAQAHTPGRFSVVH